MIIRKANLNDLAVVCSIDRQELVTSWTEGTYSSYLDNPNALFLVAQAEESVVGYILYNIGLDQSDILQFAVDNKHQKSGVGSRLLEESFKLFSGDHEFFLEVKEKNLKAINFYKKMGFEFINIRRYYYDDGQNALVYRKVI